MTEKELPDPIDPASREVPTEEELHRELVMGVPEFKGRAADADPRVLALRALSDLDPDSKKVYVLHLGLSKKGVPTSFSEIADSMNMPIIRIRRLYKVAGMHLGRHVTTLEQIAEEKRQERMRGKVDLEGIAIDLNQQEFEALEMIAEGRTWAEAADELELGGLSGAHELRRKLAERLGIDPEKVDELAPELTRLHIESWGREE